MPLVKKLVLGIFFIAIFLVGCTTSTSRSKEVDIFTGTEGLNAEFSNNAPPPKVFEDNLFPILIKLRNNGVNNIKSKSGIIAIGAENDYIKDITAEENSRIIQSKEIKNHVLFDIDGKSKINAKGEEMAVVLSAKAGKLDPQSENKASTMTATLCYPYKTTLSTTVCIDPDITGLRPAKKVCNVNDIFFSNGQGAPIAITKIEPQMLPDADKSIIRPQFLIYIENKGRGNPVNPKNYQSICGKQDVSGRDLWNVAFLKAYTTGKDGVKELICCPNQEKCPENDISTGFIRFIDNKDFVRCTFKDGVPRNFDAFTSPLRIEVDYGYVQTATTNFLIQKPLKY